MVRQYFTYQVINDTIDGGNSWIFFDLFCFGWRERERDDCVTQKFFFFFFLIVENIADWERGVKWRFGSRAQY